MRPPAGARDPIAGPDSGPESPFPIQISGPVVKGFGRGSKELGIPTANIPLSGLSVGGHSELASGIYFGWAGLDTSLAQNSGKAYKPDESIAQTNAAAESSLPTGSATRSNGVPEEKSTTEVYPCVLSIGYNPFYANTVRSIEVHIMHTFHHDFYDAWLNLSILGFIRPEYDYVSKESLIEDIKTDIEVSGRSLGREKWRSWREDGWLREFPSGDEQIKAREEWRKEKEAEERRRAEEEKKEKM